MWIKTTLDICGMKGFDTNTDYVKFLYLFLTLAVVWTLLRLEEADFSVVLGHLDQRHGRPHCGVTSVDEHHHLTHEGHNIKTCDSPEKR